MRTILIILSVLLTGWSQAETVEGKVVEVIDGNTVKVESEGEFWIFWLDGADAPELSQDYGLEAKSYLEKLALNKKVTVELLGKDRYGNRKGKVTRRGNCLATEMLDAGLAWSSRTGTEEMKQAEEMAKTEQRGLWKASDPTPPWIYVRKASMGAAKSS